jgi:hypothetical protein
MMLLILRNGFICNHIKLVAKTIWFSLYAAVFLFGFSALADYSLKRVVRLETGKYYSFSGLTKQTTIQEIESGVGLLGYETYHEMKDPLFLLNYGIETYFIKNWYEPNGYRFTTYSSTGPKGVAEKTSWAAPDPKDIPFRKWNAVAPDQSYTNQSTTLLLKPFQSQALPPRSVDYGYFLVSVIMFTPNGVVVPPQEIRVAGKSLDVLGNAYITTQLNSGYINITPTTGYCDNYHYTLIVTELSPKIELFEPNSNSEIAYVDDLDNNADTTLVFVQRGSKELNVLARPSIPIQFFQNGSIPGFKFISGVYDDSLGLFKRRVNVNINSALNVSCQFGGVTKTLNIVVFDSWLKGCAEKPGPRTKSVSGHAWWDFFLSSPAKEILVQKKIIDNSVLGQCGFWSKQTKTALLPMGPAKLVFGDQGCLLDSSRVYQLGMLQIFQSSKDLVHWRGIIDYDFYNLFDRNCATTYIDFSNSHALSGIPYSIFSPLGLANYWESK